MPDTPTTPAVPCRHCGDPLKRQEREGEHWTHAHGRYRCQRKVTYGHNAAHPDVPCVPGGPNPCKCTYDPDPEPRCSHYDDGDSLKDVVNRLYDIAVRLDEDGRLPVQMVGGYHIVTVRERDKAPKIDWREAQGA